MVDLHSLDLTPKVKDNTPVKLDLTPKVTGYIVAKLDLTPKFKDMELLSLAIHGNVVDTTMTTSEFDIFVMENDLGNATFDFLWLLGGEIVFAHFVETYDNGMLTDIHCYTICLQNDTTVMMYPKMQPHNFGLMEQPKTIRLASHKLIKDGDIIELINNAIDLPDSYIYQNFKFYKG